MQKTTIPLLFSLSFITYSSAVHATDKDYCQSYSRALINLPHKNESKNVLAVCKADQPHWSSNKAKHLEWCLDASQAEADKKLYAHNKLVNLCNDTYKLVMIDLQRCATPALSHDDAIKMTPASETLKNALFGDNKLGMQSPYSTLYPTIQTAIKEGVIQQCDIHSLAVDLDNNTKTKEWVLSTDSHCLANKKRGHIWLVQQLGDNYRVLFEGEDNSLTLRYSETNQFKNITIASRLHPDEETEKRCGSIIADWQYIDGRYIPVKGKADEHGNCLPPYNLPDYLQSADSDTLAPGEWEKNIKLEDKKRIALHTPYKQALNDYIPEWLEKIGKLIPAIAELEDSTNTQEPKKNKQDKNNGDDKSFMQNVKSFLGFE